MLMSRFWRRRLVHVQRIRLQICTDRVEKDGNHGQTNRWATTRPSAAASGASHPSTVERKKAWFDWTQTFTGGRRLGEASLPGLTPATELMLSERAATAAAPAPSRRSWRYSNGALSPFLMYWRLGSGVAGTSAFPNRVWEREEFRH
jgi:hypothetical protein